MKCLDCPNHIMRPSLRCHACAYRKRLLDKRRQNRERRQRQQAQRKPTMPRVIVHIDEDGQFSYYTEAGVELLFVDERAPDDRVYKWSGTATTAEVESILSDDPAGHRFDDSEAAITLGQRLN
jgi:hypothetical protein